MDVKVNLPEVPQAGEIPQVCVSQQESPGIMSRSAEGPADITGRSCFPSPFGELPRLPGHHRVCRERSRMPSYGSLLVCFMGILVESEVVMNMNGLSTRRMYSGQWGTLGGTQTAQLFVMMCFSPPTQNSTSPPRSNWSSGSVPRKIKYSPKG